MINPFTAIKITGKGVLTAMAIRYRDMKSIADLRI
jgi:hypothetical protein